MAPMTAEQILISQRHWDDSRIANDVAHGLRVAVPYGNRVGERVEFALQNYYGTGLSNSAKNLMHEPEEVIRVTYWTGAVLYFKLSDTAAHQLIGATDTTPAGVFPGGYSGFTQTGRYRYVQLAAADSIVWTLPAGTTRVYLLGYPSAAGSAVSVALAAHNDLVLTAAIDCTATGPFGGDVPNLSRDKWLKIAAGAIGADTITITQTGGFPSFIGLIALTDTPSDPLNDHPDPASFRPLSDRWTGGSGSVALSLRRAPAGANVRQWYGSPHWGESGNTTDLASPVETLAYLDENGALQTLTLTTDTWMKVLARGFSRDLVGTMYFSDATGDDKDNDIGTFREQYMIDPTGLFHSLTVIWNQNAEDIDMRLDGTFTGGYGSMFQLKATRGLSARCQPDGADVLFSSIANETNVFDKVASGATIRTADGSIVAWWTGGTFGGSKTQVLRKDNAYNKLYRKVCGGEIDITAGQVLHCYQKLMVTPPGTLERGMAGGMLDLS